MTAAYTLSQITSSCSLPRTQLRRGMIRSISNPSALIDVLSFRRSPKRLPRPVLERRMRDAGRICNADTRSRATF